MSQKEPTPETFEEFKNSFSYGTRSNLNFKFLKNLSNEQAGEFFNQLLRKLGESLDDGDLQGLYQLVVEWQMRGYTAPGTFAYDDAPFTALSKPIARSRLMLLTSSGHFVDGQDPEPFGIKNMTQEQAEAMIDDFLKSEPVLSSIPIDTPSHRLRVRHGGYHTHGARSDPNVVFPIERLRELRQEGVVGALVDEVFSFMGATAQTRLLKQSGPQWVKRFKQKQVEAALLVPAWPVCHVSVGHVARLLEANGIPTVMVAVKAFRPRLEPMKVPRLLLTPHPMGRTLGAPGDRERQRTTILAALKLLETATEGGTIVELTEAYRFKNNWKKHDGRADRVSQ